MEVIIAITIPLCVMKIGKSHYHIQVGAFFPQQIAKSSHPVPVLHSMSAACLPSTGSKRAQLGDIQLIILFLLILYFHLKRPYN